ncbi:MAG: hypothetical protein ACK4FL_03595 [Microgenomates group bacterium]
MKILKIFFIVLLILIIGESLFLLYFYKEKYSPKVGVTNFSFENLFQNERFLNYFRQLGRWADNKLLKNLIVTEEYEGMIKEIVKKKGNYDGFEYVLKISLYRPENKIETIRLLNERDLSLMKFYNAHGNEIELESFKKGDLIKLSLTSSYLSSLENNLISGYIKKIR